MTLTEFLLARIAEDEEVARSATRGPWTVAGPVVVWPFEETSLVVAQIGDDDKSQCDGDHIARHDPARVLAECEAKRRIVSRCDMVLRGREHGMFSDGQQVDANDNLRALAAVYSDHPDYDEAWRP